MTSSEVIAMPISAKQAASARQAMTSLSIKTPSQSKMISCGAGTPDPDTMDFKSGPRQRRRALRNVGRERRLHHAAELGVPAYAAHRLAGLHHRPGGRVGNESAEHGVIKPMASSDGTIGPLNGRAGKREITDGIERLVTDELVGKAQAFRIEHAVVGHDHGILERGAERITGAPQTRHVAREAEGARPRQLAAERRRIDIEGAGLLPDQGVIEVDVDFDPEAA